jgi:N-methylhydantoinase A/oxoprolinase/acetone carboxylase beta subunit
MKSNNTLSQVVKELDVDGLVVPLKQVLASGITSLAVVLMHSYNFAEHEAKVISLSGKKKNSVLTFLSHILHP